MKAKTYITSNDLRVLVSKQIGRKLSRGFNIYISDDRFYCPSINDMDLVIKKSSVDKNTWVSNSFDCDDFAHVLKADFARDAYKHGERRAAHCFGIVWGMLPGPHAINWVVNDDLELVFIEPQTDEIFYPRESDRDIYFMLV